MNREEFAEQFSNYRHYLGLEVMRLSGFVSVYLQIQERKKDQLAVLNLAPAFFQTVEGSLFSSIILWVDKLLDEHGQRGLFNFLTFVEENRKWLSVKELQLRKGYPDGHWMLKDRSEITLESIEADRERIRALNGLKNIRIRRDKFHGHFDKKYFFKREKIAEDAPILSEEMNQIISTIGEIINGYSADFDGALRSWDWINAGDLDILLSRARKKT